MDIVELGMDVDSRPLKKTNAEMDRFAAQGKRVDGAARGVTKSTGAMAAGMKRAALAIGATVAAMASLGGGIRTLAQFEKQMSTVGAVSRATAAEMQAMRDVAADLGSTTEFTAKQAGQGLEFLARAGFSASESIKAIPAVLDLATASAMGLGAAADISSNIMSAFGIAAGEAASVADVLAAASSRANTDVQQLGDAMSFVGPVASSLGIEMSAAAAAIGVLSDAGIQGSSAGTGLRRVLSSLAKPTKEAADTLASLGLQMETLNPQTNDLTSIIEQLAGSGLSAADALTIFGDRGGPAILALTSQTGRLVELTGALRDVDGEARRMAQYMRDNLGGDLDSLWSSVQGLVIALGDAGLTAAIRGVIQGLTALARGATAVAEAIEVLGVAIVSLAATRLPALVLSMRAATAGLTLMHAQFVAGAVAARGLAVAAGLARGAIAFLGGPIGIVAGLLTAGAGAFLLWRDNAGQAETGSYDAADGTIALNAALGVFHDTAAPKAGAAAIALAENNVKLANSSFEAAKAELAKRRAFAEGAAENFAPGPTQRSANFAAEQAAKDLAEQERALEQAIRDRNVASEEVLMTLPVLGAGTSDVADANAELLKQIEGLKKGLSGGSGGGVAGSLEDLKDEMPISETEAFDKALEDAGMTAEEFGTQKANILISGVDSMSNSWTDFVMRGFSDFKGFVDSVLDSFKSMLSQMIAMAARNQILIGINTALGGSVAGTAASALGGGGGLLGNLLGGGGSGGGLLGGLLGGGGFLNGVGGGLQASLGLGGFASQGLFSVGANATVASAATGASALSSTIGAALGPIGLIGGGIMAVASLFKKKKKTIDSGLFLLVDGLDSMVESFKRVKKSSILGGSSKETFRREAEAAVADPIKGLIEDLQFSLSGLSDGIGVQFDNILDQFATEIKVSTFKMDEAEAQEALAAGLAEMSDQMAAQVLAVADGFDLAQRFQTRESKRTLYGNILFPNQDAANVVSTEVVGSAPTADDRPIIGRHRGDPIYGGGQFNDRGRLVAGMHSRAVIETIDTLHDYTSRFAREGETATETLERLSASIQAANPTLRLLNQTMFEVSIAGADMASSLADAFGGIEAMQAASQQYYDLFFTDAEKMANLIRETEAAFNSINVTMPKTRAEYRALVEAQDLATQSGRETYAALVGLAGAMNEVLPAVENFTREIEALVGGITTDVDGMIAQAASAQRESAQAASLWYRTSQTLRAFISDLRGTAGALVTGAQAQAFNEARFQSLLGSAIAGDNQAAGDLPRAARALLDSSRAQARTRVEAARMEARVLSDLGLAAGVADVEGARHDVIAGLLGSQVELLGDVRDYLTGGGALDPDQIDALNAQLGDLQAGIKAAEMINYAFLKERLDVTVDLLATADLPADVRRLIANAQDGVEGTIDFVVRSDLTPDQKWLALTGSSELIKTLDFVLGRDVDNGTRVIALTSASSLNRTINLLAGSDVSEDLRRIALAGNSELARVVNVALSSGADQRAIQLALGNAGAYSVAVRAALNAPADVQQIVFGDAGSYAAMVEAAFTQDLSADLRRVLLEQQGIYAVNVLGTLGASVSEPMRRLLLNANTSAIRGITVAMAFPDTVSAAERELLLREGTTAIRTIQAAVNPAGITPIGALYLDQLAAGNGNVFRNISPYISMWKLDEDGQTYLDQLAAGSGNVYRNISPYISTWKIDEDGNAYLDQLSAGAGSVARAIAAGIDLGNVRGPQDAYFGILARYGTHTARHLRAGVDLGLLSVHQTAYFDQLRAGSGAISRVLQGRVDIGSLDRAQRSLLEAVQGDSTGTLRLGGSFVFDPSASFSTWFGNTTRDQIAMPMNSLRGTITDLTAMMRREERAGMLNDFSSRLVSAGKGQFIATDDQIRHAAGIAGVNAGGNIADVAARVSGFMGGDAISKLGIYTPAMRQFLLEQAQNPAIQINDAAYHRARPDLSRKRPDLSAQEHWDIAGRAEMLRDPRWFNPRMFDWSSIGINIPGFARGGMHAGGWRMVGEQGPEVEYTGPSRVVSNSETRAMLDNREVVAELRRLRAELEDMKNEQRQIGMANLKHVKRTGDAIYRWDKTDGVPVVNPTDGTRLKVDTTA